MGLFCVSIDLDEIDCYHAIHGLPAPPEQVSQVVYSRALGRVARFLEELKIPGTFFVVGKDLRAGSSGVGVLGDLLRRGHELGR